MSGNDRMGNDRQTAKDIELDMLLRDLREDIPEPSMRLMNAVLADAADVSASRSQAGEPARKPVRAQRWPDNVRGVLAALGGWPAATALAVCAVIGFGVGVSTGSDTASSLIWGETVALEFPSDTVPDYFDAAVSEG